MKYRHPSTQRGFTLIELMVTVGIFVFFTGMTLMNYPKFKNNTAIALLAHDVALTVRQAQSYGLAVRSFGNHFPPWGAHFSTDTTLGGNMVLFADAKDWTDSIADTDTTKCNTDNCMYDVGASGQCAADDIECVEVYKMPSGARVRDVCVDSLQNCGFRGIDIVYQRPDPGATFCLYTDSYTSCSRPGTVPESVLIRIGYPDSTEDELRSVKIFTTGQISVQ